MLIDALQLPSTTRVSVHINKTILKQQGVRQELIDAITTANGKKQLFDIAILAPRTANVVAHIEPQRTCAEVHVLDLTCDPKYAVEIENALFAHIPYALVIMTHCESQSHFALAKYRTSEADKSKNVITDAIRSRWFDADAPSLAALAPQPSNVDLWHYYCRLFDAIALDNARAIWPDFTDDPVCAKRATEIQQTLSRQIDELRNKLARDHELRRRAALADQIRALKSTIASLPNLNLAQLKVLSIQTQD